MDVKHHVYLLSFSRFSVTVTSGEPYLAFMLQGRTRDNRPVGRFSVAPPVSKFLSCYDDDDTLSHAAAFGRTAMEVTWHQPAEDVGDVYIMYVKFSRDRLECIFPASRHPNNYVPFRCKIRY